MKIRFIAILAPFFIYLSGCNNDGKGHNDQSQLHFSDSLFAKFEKLHVDERSRLNFKYLEDSLFATISEVSIADRCWFLDYCSEIYFNRPLGSSSIDTAIQLKDSIISLIEKYSLTDALVDMYTKAFRDKGSYYKYISNYDSAVLALNKAKQLSLKQKELCEVGKVLLIQSAIAVDQSKIPYAIELLHEALKYTETCTSGGERFYYIQRIKDDLGYLYAMEQKFDSSLYYHFQAEEYIIKNKGLKTDDTLFAYRALFNVYDNIADVYFQNKNFINAEQFINKSIQISKDVLKDNLAVIRSRIQLGLIYLESNRISKALKEFEELNREYPLLSVNFKLLFLQFAMKVTQRVNLTEQRIAYTEEHCRIRDSVNRAELELQRKDPITQLERMDKIHQVSLLQKDNLLKQNRIRDIIIISSLLALLVTIILVALSRIRVVMKNRAAVYKKLVASEQALKLAISENEVQAQQRKVEELYFQELRLQIKHQEDIMNQRQKISEDIHDDFSNSLAALNFYVNDLSGKVSDLQQKEYFKHISEELKSIYQRARTYMYNLKASGFFTQHDLLLLLEGMKENLSKNTSLAVELDIDKAGVAESLSIQQQDQLYHIINEAIANTIKYANASRLSIFIGFEGNSCKFSIADNGIGFVGNPLEQSGIGLKSMRKRMIEMEGKISIQSDAKGTVITGIFPVQTS